MVITRFNRFVAKHGRVAFIIIGLVIVIPFVFFFGPGNSGAEGRGYTGPVAKLYDQKIDRETFMHHMQAVDITAILQFGRGYSSDDRFRSYWIDETLKRLIGLEAARRRGLDAVTNEQIVEYVRNLDQFRTDEGTFDKAAFTQFMQTIKQTRKISGAEFDRMIRDSVILDRFEAILGAGVFVSDDEVESAARRGESQVALKYHQVSADDVMGEVSLTPSDQAIQDYFDEFGDTIELPAKKKILVAEFNLEDVELDDDVVAEEDVEKYYEERKRIFQRMDREAAHERIRDLLRKGQQRELAEAEAEALREAVLERMNEEDDGLSAQAAFRAAVDELADAVSEVKESGWFTPDMPIPNVGQRPRLAKAGYELTEEQPLSNIVYDSTGFHVACLLDTQPGETPEELTSEVREIIVDKLIDRKIENYYQEHVEPYRDQVEEGMTPDDMIREKRIQLNTMADASDADAEAQLAQYREDIETYLKPYYKPPQRKVLLTAFRTEDYQDEVSVSDEDAKAYYEDNKDDYSKEEVKARHILLRFDEGAEEEALEEGRAKLRRIREQIAEGADFAEMAEEHSEGPTAPKGGDLGWFSKDRMVAPFAEAAFELDKGEVSEVVKTRFGLHLIKVADRRSGQSFEEVADDIRETLLSEKAERLAKEHAYEFADQAYRAVQDRDESKPPAEVFSELARERELDPAETSWFGPQGRIRGFEQEFGLAGKAYKVTGERPVSEVIEGRQGVYVACWKGTQEGVLPAIAGNPQLKNQVRRRLKRARALELARENGRSLHQDIAEKLDEGVPFSDAVPEDVSFESIDPFKPAGGRPPRDLPQAQAVVAALEGASANTMLEPLETDDGLLLVHLAERIVPTDEELEEMKDMYRTRLRNRKQQELLGGTYEQLQEDAELELLGPWAEQQ